MQKKAEDAEKKRSDAETKKREAEEKAEREKLALKFSSGFEIFPEGCDQIIRQSPDVSLNLNHLTFLFSFEA